MSQKIHIFIGGFIQRSVQAFSNLLMRTSSHTGALVLNDLAVVSIVRPDGALKTHLSRNETRNIFFKTKALHSYLAAVCVFVFSSPPF